MERSNMHMEQTLLDANARYPDKMETLVTAWNLLKQTLGQANSQAQEDYASHLMRNSVQMVLQAEWKSTARALKEHLKMLISSCVQNLKSKNKLLAAQCHSILLLLDDPWEDQVLKDILQDKSVDDSAALRFLKSDRYILRTRLNILCKDKKCFELAQKLAAVVWSCYKRDRHLLSFFIEEDLHYILDLHLILLVRQGKQNCIITQMKELPMQQGAQFIKRLKQHHYPSDGNKLWKKSRRALEIVVQLLATRAIREPLENVRGTLNDLMAEWVEMFSLDPEFQVMIGKLASLSISVDHLLALTNALELICHGKHRPKCVELFIKRMTSEVNQMNDLRNLGNEAQLHAAKEHLSAGFLQVAGLLSDNLQSCRECVLTAFSLNPTAECLQRLEELAKRSQMVKQALQDTGHSGEQSMSAMHDGLTHKQIDNDSTTLDQSLQDDLYIVLKNARNSSLNWQLEWPELKRRCEEHYVSVTIGEQPAIQELKYLELDYSQFKNMTTQDENYGGIEKGYEPQKKKEKRRKKKKMKKCSNNTTRPPPPTPTPPPPTPPPPPLPTPTPPPPLPTPTPTPPPPLPTPTPPPPLPTPPPPPPKQYRKHITVHCPVCKAQYSEYKVDRLKKHITQKHPHNSTQLIHEIQILYPPLQPKGQRRQWCNICNKHIIGTITNYNRHIQRKH